MNNQLIPFEGKEIRKIWHNEEWFFSVVDIIHVLTDSVSAKHYWATLKKREVQLVTNCQQLKIKAADGKNYKTDCAHTEGVFRIIMSVPSPKAETLKIWLASLGKQAINETENPELGFERMAEIYKAKGHTDEWIKNRLQSIETRKLLTDEWKNRSVKENQEYGILTATIAKGTFGLVPSEHKKLKNLDKPTQELRDHMTPLELILVAFGEEVTRQIAITDDAQGFSENHDAASKGGALAGQARQNVENQLKKTVVSSENFLDINTTKEIK